MIRYYAEEQAKKSNMSKKYGCIIIHRNKIVGQGYNYSTSAPTKYCIL